MQDVLNYLDGRMAPALGGEWLDDVDPATGQSIARVASSDSRDIDKAVAAAVRAFPAWSQSSAADRSRVLRRIARLIERDLEKLARAESIDAGKPLSVARTVDIPRAVQNFDFFADAATQFASEAHVTDQTAVNYTLRQPLGAV
jgi:aminomuconate-semialdehyde/2-hydroxymuconate-6-semialdehyde dehydrogenase